MRTMFSPMQRAHRLPLRRCETRLRACPSRSIVTPCSLRSRPSIFNIALKRAAPMHGKRATPAEYKVLAHRNSRERDELVVDDLRPALGAYGDRDAYTPNIDKLAERSMLFSQTYAQQSLCAPSRNSLLTSRRPDSLQLYDFYSYWRDTVGNFTTIPEHLKNHGYLTKSVGKVFHPGISCNRSDDSPYSWSEKPFHPYTNRYKNSPVCRLVGNSSGTQNIVCPVSVDSMPEETLPDLETLNAAKIFIHNQSKDTKPFFLAVGFQKPHIPLKYPREYLKYHPLSKFNIVEPYAWPKNVSNVAYNPWSDLRERDDVRALLLDFPWQKIPVDFAKTIIQSYYAAVTYIDDLIGKLLDQLRTSNLHRNTAVILTSDHGWSLGEHGEWAKYSNFEVAVRVPLLISIPRSEPRVTVTNVGASGFLYPITEFQELRQDRSNRLKIKRQTIGRIVGVNDKLRRRDSRESIKKTEYKVPEGSNIRVDAMVELVDLFPTIAELAGHPIPMCPDTEDNYDNSATPVPAPNLCSEGISLVPLVKAALEDKTLSWKKAAFSQYPRPGLEPTLHPNSDKPHLREINIMGYTLRTNRFRYTVWVKFCHRTKKPDWHTIVAEELYDHNVDPGENSNVENSPAFVGVKEDLMTLVRRGWRRALPDPIESEI